jgi:L-asparaginase
MAALARLTSVVQKALASGQYTGAIWLEGSPFVEETIYWLNLLIDTTVPIVGNSSQRPHGAIGNDGDRNIVDSVDYITSRIWADETRRDYIGAVAILDEQIFTARDVQKPTCAQTATSQQEDMVASSAGWDIPIAAVFVQDRQAPYAHIRG